MKEKLKYYFLSGIVLFAPFIGGSSGIGLFEVKHLLEAKNEPIEAIVEEKDTELLAQIDKLAMCESSYRDDIKIVDTNGWHSYGRYQFQLPTFRGYAEAYEIVPKGLSDDELREYIYDGELQAELVYKMLEDNPSNWTHWYNCAKKIGTLV